MSDVRSQLWTSNIDPTKAGIAQKYVDQATATYDPQYNSQLTAAQNALNQKINTLNNSKTGINKNYDTQVDTQNRNSKNSENTFSNQTLSRGLGRSSILTSGIGEMENVKNRLVNTINTARTNSLNEVDSNIATEKNNFENTKTELSGDRMSKIIALARDLQSKQDEIDRDEKWKQKQYDEQVREFNANQAAQAAARAASYSRSRSSGSSKKKATASTADQNYSGTWTPAPVTNNTNKSDDGRTGGFFNWVDDNVVTPIKGFVNWLMG